MIDLAVAGVVLEKSGPVWWKWLIWWWITLLSQDETDAFHDLIRSLLICCISSTHNLIFAAISHLKRAKESDVSSRRWFQAWWKNNELHKIKIKSLAIVRYFAAQMSDDKQWFVNYRNILQELSIIRSQNIWNFDEADFRVSCMQKRNILMSKNISDFYSISSENRKFLIIIEDVNAADHKLILSLLVIQRQRLMQNWVQLELFAETLIKTFENKFINDQIIIEWLKHFILHTNSSTNSLQEWKLLFMNQHDSHCILEFIRFANDHRIRSFSFISHLIHCMQSLNVNIFHSYKKHHDNVIKQALTKFHMQYSLKRFCNDLNQIREHTFKKNHHSIRIWKIRHMISQFAKMHRLIKKIRCFEYEKIRTRTNVARSIDEREWFFFKWSFFIVIKSFSNRVAKLSRR